MRTLLAAFILSAVSCLADFPAVVVKEGVVIAVNDIPAMVERPGLTIITNFPVYVRMGMRYDGTKFLMEDGSPVPPEVAFREELVRTVLAQWSEARKPDAWEALNLRDRVDRIANLLDVFILLIRDKKIYPYLPLPDPPVVVVPELPPPVTIPRAIFAPGLEHPLVNPGVVRPPKAEPPQPNPIP